MAEQFPQLNDKLSEFIKSQHLFFVATAASKGKVNLSPKGMDSLRILSPARIVWLNLTGSGNESAAHVLEVPRMTLMFCSFDQVPLILRVYASAYVVHERDEQWQELIQLFPHYVGARQIFDLNVEMVQTSCGFAVPYFEYKSDRETLINSANKRGREGIRDYWKEKNQLSLDGMPTQVLTEQ